MSDYPTLAEMAEGPTAAWPYTTQTDARLAQEIVDLRDWKSRHQHRMESQGKAIDEHTARLDSHNRVMESIVRRVRVLEQQARPEQEDGHLAVEACADCLRSDRTCMKHWAPQEWLDALGKMEQRAETAERERDEWQASANRRLDEREAALAKVERLRGALRAIQRGVPVSSLTFEFAKRALDAAALEDA